MIPMSCRYSLSRLQNYVNDYLKHCPRKEMAIDDLRRNCEELVKVLNAYEQMTDGEKTKLELDIVVMCRPVLISGLAVSKILNLEEHMGYTVDLIHAVSMDSAKYHADAI